MESTNRTSIEKPSWTEVSFSSIGLLVFYHISRVTPYPFPTFCAYHDVSFELPGGNGRDSRIAGWENMRMGFKFQMGMGWECECEWSHWNGRELVRKICSRTPLERRQRNLEGWTQTLEGWTLTMFGMDRRQSTKTRHNVHSQPTHNQHLIWQLMYAWFHNNVIVSYKCSK